MKICWKRIHHQVIQNVDEFIFIFIIIIIRFGETNGSSAVNGCRQNESPNSW